MSDVCWELKSIHIKAAEVEKKCLKGIGIYTASLSGSEQISIWSSINHDQSDDSRKLASKTWKQQATLHHLLSKQATNIQR